MPTARSRAPRRLPVPFLARRHPLRTLLARLGLLRSTPATRRPQAARG